MYDDPVKVHEAGHAVAAWSWSRKVHSISIRAGGDDGGGEVLLEQPETGEVQALVACAGSAAVAMLCTGLIESHWDLSVADAAAAREGLEAEGLALDRHTLRALWARMDRLVGGRIDEIVALAGLLPDRGTLFEEDLAGICRETPVLSKFAWLYDGVASDPAPKAAPAGRVTKVRGIHRVLVAGAMRR
jgi:hypothetical protein